MEFDCFVIGHRGKIRENNEDNACANGFYCDNDNALTWGHECDSASTLLAAVFDGLGGEAHGEVASKLAAMKLSAINDKDFTKEVERYVADTNSEIALYDACNNIGTTFAAFYVKDNIYHFYNIGDSRVYLFRNGELSQMTRDHNLVRRMQREGILTKEQADRHPQRNSISQFLGMKENGIVIQPECYIKEHVAAMHGDIVLACTDGLTEMVSDEDICRRLSMEGSLREKAQELIQMALDAGGRDNVTIVLAQAM